jgi:hypothetical protein
MAPDALPEPPGRLPFGRHLHARLPASLKIRALRLAGTFREKRDPRLVSGEERGCRCILRVEGLPEMKPGR